MFTIAKYRKKPVIVEADLFKLGMEDYFKYYIPMFGLFTKQECFNSGFTPDFEEDKIPFIVILEGEYPVEEGKHYIVTDVKGECYPVEKEIFEETYEIVKE